jgi:hypothetical protein
VRNDLFPAARLAPQSYQDILARFGQNLYGENLLRLIWLPARFYTAGGWWEVEREFAYKRVPKYGIKNQRWAIEKWMPANTYGTPDTWERSTLSPEGFMQVGPFPVHGEYESAAVFSVGQGPQGYVPLEPGTVLLQAQLIHLGRQRSIWDIRHSIRSDQEMIARRQDESFETMWQSVRHSRTGLTLGPAGNYSEQNAINEYKARLLAHREAWIPEADYQHGFSQTGDV